jgi:hypothetical protein
LVFGGDHHGSNGVEWLKSSGVIQMMIRRVIFEKKPDQVPISAA